MLPVLQVVTLLLVAIAMTCALGQLDCTNHGDKNHDMPGGSMFTAEKKGAVTV